MKKTLTSRSKTTVADVMTQVLVTVAPDMPIDEAMDLLAERHISGAPVVDAKGKLVGVLSSSDLLRAGSSKPGERETTYYLEDELSDRICEKPSSDERTVMDIATRKVVAIDENASIEEAARILFDLGIRRLLVTRQGKLAGIVSAMDIVKWVGRPSLEG